MPWLIKPVCLLSHLGCDSDSKHGLLENLIPSFLEKFLAVERGGDQRMKNIGEVCIVSIG
jgi:hypothetical protein